MKCMEVGWGNQNQNLHKVDQAIEVEVKRKEKKSEILSIVYNSDNSPYVIRGSSILGPEQKPSGNGRVVRSSIRFRSSSEKFIKAQNSVRIRNAN